MTKYQLKRQFINKINKRIKTLTKRAGVDIEDIKTKLDGIDGIYFMDDTDNLNIDTSYFTEALVKRIEKAIPTWLSAYDREVQDITDYAKKSDLFGPVDLRPSVVNKAIASRFSADADFEEDIQKYYEWEATQDELDLSGNENAAKIRDLLGDLGSAWYNERYAEARGIMREIKSYGVDIDALKEW